MNTDPLSNDVSVSAQLTETGVNASAKSRTVSAADRLFGNILDMPNPWFERRSSMERERIETERRIVQAATDKLIEQIKVDDELARNILHKTFYKAASAQINKDAVFVEAIEHLKSDPPTEQQCVSGPETLDEAFLGRFERYAEEATTDELRQRWGKVLAAEIRQPGTFNAKVLRVVDELDPTTAYLFERLLEHRIRENAVSETLYGELGFEEKLALVGAGLIFDPGNFGHVNRFVSGTFADGTPVWLMQIGKLHVGFKKTEGRNYGNNGILRENSGFPATPIYLLTDVGTAVASIIETDMIGVAKRFLSALIAMVSADELIVVAPLENGQTLLLDLDKFLQN